MAGQIERALRGDKYDKDEVQFEHPASHGDCDDCKHWQSPDSCEIVKGKVLEEDWCDKFDRK
jgi:hypothetical protein